MMYDQTWEEVLPHEVSEKIKSGRDMNIIDVREPDEWISGHIPGARLIPLRLLPVKKMELDRNSEYLIVCHSGSRSTRACEYLTDEGFKVINMLGGMSHWTGDLAYGK